MGIPFTTAKVSFSSKPSESEKGITIDKVITKIMKMSGFDFINSTFAYNKIISRVTKKTLNNPAY